jgi:NhaP-type Na+/H+ or K+/H+ antiporter
VGLAVIIVMVMVLVRFLWMFGMSYFPGVFKRRRKNRFPWQEITLIAWTGLRGADSLAGALAIPFLLPSGAAFPGRDIILLLTFCVIFGTLVVQGLTVTPLVRWLGVVDDHATEREERLARLKANEMALARLEELERSQQARPETIERLRAEYLDRIAQLHGESPHSRRLYSADFEDLACELLQAERETVITLRNEEAISDQALRRIQRDIDLAEARLHRPD